MVCGLRDTVFAFKVPASKLIDITFPDEGVLLPGAALEPLYMSQVLTPYFQIRRNRLGVTTRQHISLQTGLNPMQAVQVPFQSNIYLQAVSDIRALTVRDSSACPLSPELDHLTSASEHAAALVLSVDENENSIQRVTDLMRQHVGIAHLDLVVQAQSDGFYLGKICLNSENLERYAWDLQEWFSGIHSSAESDRPQLYIHVTGVRDIKQLNSVTRTLAQLTGAEVRVFNF